MATSNESPRSAGRVARTWNHLLEGRPLLALAVVWLTTAGHTMNFREMGIAHGWVAPELYCLQTVFGVFIALSLLTSPWLGRCASCGRLAQLGLLLLAASSFLNGWYIHAPLVIFLAGRAVAGVGVGLVIYFAPRLLGSRWENPTTWASILLPVCGPGAVAAASMVHSWSGWEWGFLIPGFAASICLLLLLFREGESGPCMPGARGWPAYLPFLALASIALVYCLHWGQLYGWLESPDIVLPGALGTAFLAGALYFVYPRLDVRALKQGLIRLLLFFFGGACQFFLVLTMNLYGGLLLNFSTWQRSWLVWSLPLGVASGLAVARMAGLRWGIRLGFPGAIAGLLILAAGFFHSYERTLDWPYWQIQNVADLNWFPAPQHWELGPGRFLMGLGIGLFMFAMDTLVNPDTEREAKIRPLLLATQFYGGGVGIAVVVNFFLIGHPVHYSYVADRDVIQADELAQRQAVLRDALFQAGEQAPDRQAEVLLFRTVNYESDNLVFATLYATFVAVALVLAAVCLCLLFWNRLRVPGGSEAG